MTHNTVQRTAIRAVLEEAARPMGPAEILEAAQEHVPQLGMTTVYRTLKALVDEHWLDVVALPGEPSRYERAGAGSHAFFRCEECDRVYRAPGNCPGVLAIVPDGFALSSHSLVLYGVCGHCREAHRRPSEGEAGTAGAQARTPETSGPPADAS